MKFRKHMEELKVSEWDSQYLNYKAGKRRIKEICATIPNLCQGNSKSYNPISALLHGRAGFRKIEEQQQYADQKCDNRGDIRGDIRGTLRRSSTFMASPLIQRMAGFSPTSTLSKQQTPLVFSDTISAQKIAEAEFTEWLLAEVARIDAFYRQKEKEAVARFRTLEEQLVIMQRVTGRNSLTEVILSKLGQEPDSSKGATIDTDNLHTFLTPEQEGYADYERSRKYRKPINKPIDSAARKRLKHACSEYYRRLEALRSYIAVNREAFRKITKKFDKMSSLGMSARFMNNHINKSYFGGMENKLDQLINGTELLVAKYFWENNRRRAAAKLRTRGNKSGYHSSFLRSGIYLGMSLIFLDDAVWHGIRTLNPEMRGEEMAERTKFVMRLWAGIGLILLQASLFTVNLRMWARNKINYSFIFEFDPRHSLNYRQFLEIPSVFVLIYSICFWFSVENFWPGKLDMVHFPIIYIGIVAVMLFNPFKSIFFGQSRKYFLTTLWRLAMSGFYHVEFKDFWLGDMLSSQSYAFSQIYLFFCLYAQAWRSPSKCDSDSVQLWGILGALPAFWRFVQCFRRWADSGQWFPHLLNAIKYGLMLLTAMSLNLWRTDKNNSVYQTTYIGLAFVSSSFALFWDLVMDWSLMNPYAPYPFLRDELFFKMPWLYYFAIVFNTMMRFTWVLFIFLKSFDRWGPLVSFCIAFGEILRRFVWCILRMENEHKGNVQAMRAYRDPKLPYQFHESDEPAPTPISPAMEEPYAVPMIELSTVIHGDLETGAQKPVMKLNKSTIHRLGRTLTTAHRKDYERKTRMVEDEGDVEEEKDVALANKSANTV